MEQNFPFVNQATEVAEIQSISSTEVMTVQERVQIDSQVATAKAYPRDLNRVLTNIETLASLDPDTAASCFYCLRRNGGSAPIEGISIRMAEIIESSWGNIRVKAYIVNDDGKTVTARGECWDLESNVAESKDCVKRVTDRNGKRYSEDMVNVTMKAAIATAKRDAVLAVIPKALFTQMFQRIKNVGLGQALDIETSRTNLIANFAKLGVTVDMICYFLDIDNIKKTTIEHIQQMRGAWQAIKEGTTTAQENFIAPYEQHLAEQEQDKKKDAMTDAINKAKAEQK